MNLSGESVRAVMDFYDIDIEDLVVIYDDLDLPHGKIRLRLKVVQVVITELNR